MSDETNSPAPTSTHTEKAIQDLANGIHIRLDRIEAAQKTHTEALRTIMVGWNAFLKSAEAQLKQLFRGNIPAPLMKKLIQAAFKGIDESERRG